MLVRSPSVLPEIEDMGITSPSRSFMQQRPAPIQLPRVLTDMDKRPAASRCVSPSTRTSFTACSRNSFV
ncbi:MAG: hypothetical protein VB125_00235 [Burkholderia sp.]